MALGSQLTENYLPHDSTFRQRPHALAALSGSGRVVGNPSLIGLMP
jgi:hypothetical protein